MKIARSYAPAAMHRPAELAALNQLDSEGNDSSWEINLTEPADRSASAANTLYR
jgi:hypothetical protein